MKIRFLRSGMHVLEKQEEKDREILKFQLKRKALHPIVKVIKRCEKGFPQVVLNLPTIDGRIWFPTIFWLTCPYLHYEISRIENKGYIKRLEEEIESSVWLKRKFLEDQRRCMDIREEYFSFLKVWDPDGTFFFKRGIGGTGSYTKIKCLHLHYAFFLATGRGETGKYVTKY